MTREDLHQWHKDWENRQVSGDAYALFLNTYINILENRTCESCKYFNNTQVCDKFIARSGYASNDFCCNRYEAKEVK